MRLNGKTAEDIIRLLPPGSDVADARATLSTLAVFWEHVPARFPDGLPVPVTADRLLAFAKKLRVPAFARRFAMNRVLIMSAMQGKEARREALYAALLVIWKNAGGELTSNPKTGGPCVRYLIKAVEAITGNTLSISGTRKIIVRLDGGGSLKT